MDGSIQANAVRFNLGANLSSDIALATIRESFGRVVYTQKTHQKMVDQLNARNKTIKLCNLAALVLTTGGILAPILELIQEKNIVMTLTALTALFSLSVAVYQLSFDPTSEIESHRKCAQRLWVIRERYINLIADIKDNVLGEAEVRRLRDELVTELAKVYEDAPDTDSKAYAAAQKALKVNQEMTFSSYEIDEFLPESLRENPKSRSIDK